MGRVFLVLLTLALSAPVPALAQAPGTGKTPAAVAAAVREYRTAHETRIVTELVEFLSIPNIATDLPNINPPLDPPPIQLAAEGRVVLITNRPPE